MKGEGLPVVHPMGGRDYSRQRQWGFENDSYFIQKSTNWDVNGTGPVRLYYW